MAIYTERVQTVLSTEQYELLSQLAEQEQKPVSALIREAVEQVYFEEINRQKRRRALGKLLALEAPVSDWEQMEEEIIAGMVK